MRAYSARQAEIKQQQQPETSNFKDKFLGLVENSLVKMEPDDKENIDPIKKSCIKLVKGTVADMNKLQTIKFLNKLVQLCTENIDLHY